MDFQARLPRLIIPLAIAGVALAASACGGGGSGDPSPTRRAGATASAPTAAPTGASGGTAAQASPTVRAKDPCGYVTVADVQTATGKMVTGAPVRVNDFSCRYQTSDGGVINTGVASPVDAARFEQSQQANIGSGTLEPIACLGDKAFAIFFGVAVLKGQTSITVEISPSLAQKGGDAAIALARLLVERS